jgi:hypothetical protein
VISAALIYFAVVFSFAFLMGLFRVLVANPALGKTRAVLIELPLVLAISWISAGVLIARFGIFRNLTQRLAMGGLAFIVTMAAEIGFSVLVFGQPLSAYVESIWNPAGVLGLSGQLGFALIPAIQLAFKRMRQT